jgi:hypothetical protein
MGEGRFTMYDGSVGSYLLEIAADKVFLPLDDPASASDMLLLLKREIPAYLSEDKLYFLPDQQ